MLFWCCHIVTLIVPKGVFSPKEVKVALNPVGIKEALYSLVTRSEVRLQIVDGNNLFSIAKT
jgi:hypothetical protein